MSRKNYTKYSSKKEENKIKEEQENIVSDQESNESNFLDEIKNVEDIAVTGIVTSCVKLNVRKEPNKDSDIISVLNQYTEVNIDLTNSTEDFYKITTFDGLDGYCMKRFIAISK